MYVKYVATTIVQKIVQKIVHEMKVIAMTFQKVARIALTNVASPPNLQIMVLEISQNAPFTWNNLRTKTTNKLRELILTQLNVCKPTNNISVQHPHP